MRQAWLFFALAIALQVCGTTCVAFSSFLFSSHPSLRFLALIPIIGISICFLGAIIFLPALLRIIVDRRGLRKNH